MKDLVIKNSDFTEYLKESKSYTESWPAWKKDSIQAVGKNKHHESGSPQKTTE